MSGAGEPVWLCTGRQPGTVSPMIEVRNGGEPIPPEVLERIGQPFFSTKDAGNGLGVAYVRRVAAAHHWALSLESAADIGTIARWLVYCRACARQSADLDQALAGIAG